jgi:O-antigen ligase
MDKTIPSASVPALGPVEGLSAGWNERLALPLLLFGLVAFPFPYGGITPMGTGIVEGIAFTVLGLTLIGRPAMSRLSGLGVSIGAVSGIAVLGVLQLLPLPRALLAALSPESARVYGQASGVLALFGRGSLDARISIAPTETVGTILLTLAYLALFVSAALLLGSRPKRRLFVIVLLGGAGIHVFWAAAMRAVVPDGDDRLHGAFVNANHFSGYLEIVLTVAFAALWREVLYARDRNPGSTERARRFELRFMRLSTRALAWGFFAAAIGLTKSRGGILAAVVTTCLMIALGLAHQRLGKERLAISVLGGGVLAAALGFVILAVRQQPILRFLASDPRDPASDLRMTLWRVSIDAWRQFPVFGSGLGTFRESFRRVQPRDLKYLVEFAHSDSLQILATGGVLGLLLAALAFGMLAYRLACRWSDEPRREESAFLLAGIGALFAISLHGLMEFNMSIPAIPATLAAVLGLAWAAGCDDQSVRRAWPAGRAS